MSGQSTATVETLTAEVRTLMVGSRQVTMSVFRQLDVVSASKIQPFGRVCPPAQSGNRAPSHDHVVVVGRHSETGALVRAGLPTSDTPRRSFITYIADQSRVEAANDCQLRLDTAVRAAEKAERAAVQADRTSSDPPDPWYGPVGSPEEIEAERARLHAESAERHATAEALAAEFERLDAVVEAEGNRLVAMSREWEALPLIVLAGLR